MDCFDEKIIILKQWRVDGGLCPSSTVLRPPSTVLRRSLMSNTYDVIVVGAGHNGLVAAAYLAKTKKKVLVLERRSMVGGSVITESFGDGFTADAVWTGGRLRPDIVKDLKLAFPTTSERPPFISLQADGEHLVLDADPVKAAEAIRRFSEKD